MSYEALVRQIDSLTEEQRQEVFTLVHFLLEKNKAACERKSSCRGLASMYARPELIQFEEEVAASTFDGK